MKINELLKLLSNDTSVAPRRWRTQLQESWTFDGGDGETAHTKDATLEYIDDGSFRVLGYLKLSERYGATMPDWVDKLTVDDDAPAWLVIPVMGALRSHINVEVRDRFGVSDVPF